MDEYPDDIDYDSGAVIPWLVASIIIAMIILLVIFLPAHAHADDLPKVRVVNAIIGEAENGGMLAVACAIQNRGTLIGVYGEHSKRVKQHLYSPKVFVDAVRAYEESLHPLNCTFIDGAQHWQSRSDLDKHPSWVTVCDFKGKFGGNYFFKCP